MTHKKRIVWMLIIMMIVSSGTIFAQEMNPRQPQQQIQPEKPQEKQQELQEEKQREIQQKKLEKKQEVQQKQAEVQQKQAERKELIAKSQVIRQQKVNLIHSQNQLRRDLLEFKNELDVLRSNPNSMTEEKIRLIRELSSLMKDSRTVVDNTIGTVQGEAQALQGNMNTLDYARSLQNVERIIATQQQRLDALSRIQKDVQSVLTNMKK